VPRQRLDPFTDVPVSVVWPHLNVVPWLTVLTIRALVYGFSRMRTPSADTTYWPLPSDLPP
jgi:hypothetical protein